NVIAGQSAFLHLDGATMPDMLIKAPVAMHINLGEPPKRFYAQQKKMPQTRMGISALVRDAFTKARNYELKWREYERQLREAGNKEGEKDQKKTPMPPDRDLKMEALLSVLHGEIPVIARAERADDILTAIRLADEFGFKLILSEGAESYKLAPQLAARNIPILFGPINRQPEAIEA